MSFHRKVSRLHNDLVSGFLRSRCDLHVFVLARRKINSPKIVPATLFMSFLQINLKKENFLRSCLKKSRLIVSCAYKD